MKMFNQHPRKVFGRTYRWRWHKLFFFLTNYHRTCACGQLRRYVCMSKITLTLCSCACSCAICSLPRQLLQNRTGAGLRSVALVRTGMEASRRRHLAQAHRFLKVAFFKNTHTLTSTNACTTNDFLLRGGVRPCVMTESRPMSHLLENVACCSVHFCT